MEWEVNDVGEYALCINSVPNSSACSSRDKHSSYTLQPNALVEEMTDMVDIKNAFTEMHHMRMKEVELNSGLNKEKQNEKMVAILKTYVTQLEEQNDVLISTVAELEKETQHRVEQMEKRLKCSAKSTMEAVINLHECEEVMRSLVTQRLHIESVLHSVQKQVSVLKVENNFLRDQNFNLNHDIQALLHIIHHARSTGNWEMDCVMFCEVTPEQVFGPIQSMSPLYCDSNCLSHLKDSNIKKFSEPKVVSPFDMDLMDRSHFGVEEWRYKQRLLKGEVGELPNEHFIHKIEESHIAAEQAHTSYDEYVKPRTGSLPSLDNLVPCDGRLLRSHSSKIGLCEKQNSSFSKLEDLNHIRRKSTDCQKKKKERPPQKQSFHKSENNVQFRQAYSEPLLFMYGDGVYVYKPCEAVQKNCLHPAENLLNSLPYQSIDLTLPVEEVINHDLSACEWGYTRSPRRLSTRVDSFSMPYCKGRVLNCCCSSGDLEEVISSKDLSPCSAQSLTKIPTLCSVCDPGTCLNGVGTCEKDKQSVRCHPSRNNQRTVTLEINEVAEREFVSQCTQTFQFSSCYTIGTQTVSDEQPLNCVMKITENGFAGADIAEVQKAVELLKQNLLKAEDKVLAKEILMQQLQNHLQTAFKEIELKDKALENVEKKLDSSRKAKTSLESKISDLQQEIENLSAELTDAKCLSDRFLLDVESKKDDIEELHQQEQVLQNQKRSLMIQLDTRCDELDAAKTELSAVKEELKNCKTQVTQQTHIIQNLQEALVKSKRALDECVMKHNSQQALSRTSHSSNSIVNI